MKKIFFIISVFLTLSSYSQINRYSDPVKTAKFKPITSSEIMRVPLALQKKYDENQKYLYQLKKWIIELQTQIKVEKYNILLEDEYDFLTSIEDGDLARATKILNDSELNIMKIIKEYNNYVEKFTNVTFSYKFITSIASSVNKAFLIDKPNIFSSVIYEIPLDSDIYVIEYSNEDYYKVNVNGKTGYIYKRVLRNN